MSKHGTLIEKFLSTEAGRISFGGEMILVNATNTLAELMEKEEVTYEDLASKVKKDSAYIKRFFEGGDISLKMLGQLFAALGYVNVDFTPKKLEE